MLSLIKKMLDSTADRDRLQRELRRRTRPPVTPGASTTQTRDRYQQIQEMMERARQSNDNITDELLRARRLHESTINRQENNVAQMRVAHLDSNRIQIEPRDPPENLNLEDLINGSSNLPLADVVRAMALEIMTLRDEVGTLEERLQTAEYYSEVA